MTKRSDPPKDEATILLPTGSEFGAAQNLPTSAPAPLYEETVREHASEAQLSSYRAVHLGIGSMLKDTFELVSVLGEGGMGTVYKALNKVWASVDARDPYVAVKVLKPELSTNKQLVRSLYSDFDRTKMLANCPNIVNVYGFDRDGPFVYMTMEYLSGSTLNKYLNHQPMDLAQAWFIVEGIGKALAYAHENNIVHRDIKPGNVMVTEHGTVKVLDFGIASKVNENEGDKTKYGGHELGALTVAYASPEMLRDYPPDPRDDIYAFACVIYEVLTGKKFYEQKIRKVDSIKGLNHRQMDALNKALAFERDQRTGNIPELLEKLRPVKISPLKYHLRVGSGLLLVLGCISWGINKFIIPFEIEQPPAESSSHPQSTVPPLPEAPASVSESVSAHPAAPIESTDLRTQTPAEAGREPDNSSTSSDGVVHIRTSKPRYKVGESFRLDFTLTQPMYVRVIDRDAGGEVTTLLPNPRQSDELLPAHINHTFPPGGFNVSVKGPVGNSSITLIASVRPFSKAVELLAADGNVSGPVRAGSYSWAQIRYVSYR